MNCTYELAFARCDTCGGHWMYDELFDQPALRCWAVENFQCEGQMTKTFNYLPIGSI